MSSWEFLGGENENMWMLTEDGLRKLCAQYKIDEQGTKDELIARLVRHRNAMDSSVGVGLETIQSRRANMQVKAAVSFGEQLADSEA